MCTYFCVVRNPFQIAENTGLFDMFLWHLNYIGLSKNLYRERRSKILEGPMRETEGQLDVYTAEAGSGYAFVNNLAYLLIRIHSG